MIFTFKITHKILLKYGLINLESIYYNTIIYIEIFTNNLLCDKNVG